VSKNKTYRSHTGTMHACTNNLAAGTSRFYLSGVAEFGVAAWADVFHRAAPQFCVPYIARLRVAPLAVGQSLSSSRGRSGANESEGVHPHSPSYWSGLSSTHTQMILRTRGLEPTLAVAHKSECVVSIRLKGSCQLQVSTAIIG
jgi:hypothetical protein